MFDAPAELDAIAVDLTRAPGKVQRGSVKVVTASSKRVQDASRRRASGIGHAPHYPRSITTDVRIVAGAVEAEIGPDKALPQGALGNILEFGTSNNPPIPHLGPSGVEEAPRFEDDLSKEGDPW